MKLRNVRRERDRGLDGDAAVAEAPRHLLKAVAVALALAHGEDFEYDILDHSGDIDGVHIKKVLQTQQSNRDRHGVEFVRDKQKIFTHGSVINS